MTGTSRKPFQVIPHHLDSLQGALFPPAPSDQTCHREHQECAAKQVDQVSLGYPEYTWNEAVVCYHVYDCIAYLNLMKHLSN